MADHDSRAGMYKSTPAILDFCQRTHVGDDAALAAAFTPPEGIPAIMVSPHEGKFLEVLARMLRPRRVVEVGTLVGYSTIHLARGMVAGGAADAHLWTVEYDPRHAEVAKANLARAGLHASTTVCVGAGVEVLPTLSAHGPFDLVFIDADKDNYPNYARWALDHLRPGGVIVGDNTYLFGELLDDSPRGRAMREFHQLVAARCDSVCVPTPEGMVVGVVRG